MTRSMHSLKAVVAAAVLVTATSVWAQVRIGVITSGTGASAFVGIPQKNAVELLPKKIGQLDVRYIPYDDASEPTTTVQLAKKLISEHQVDAIIGPSGSPNAVALIPFVAEARVPMLAPVGNSMLVLPMDDQKRWVFKTHPNDDVVSRTLVAAMVERGVKTVGFIGYNDPYGESWHRTFVPMAEAAGIRLIADERYSRRDTSVAAQAIKLVAAKPDAVLVAGVAAGAALPQVQLIEAGYKGGIYHTHGSASGAFLKIGGKAAENALIAGPILLVLDEVSDQVASRAVATEFVTRYESQFRERPPIFAAGIYDAGLLLQEAIPEAQKSGKPGTPEFRAALRDALENAQGIVTSQGKVDMSPQDHSGFDSSGTVLLTVKAGAFRLLRE